MYGEMQDRFKWDTDLTLFSFEANVASGRQFTVTENRIQRKVSSWAGDGKRSCRRHRRGQVEITRYTLDGLEIPSTMGSVDKLEKTYHSFR